MSERGAAAASLPLGRRAVVRGLTAVGLTTFVPLVDGSSRPVYARGAAATFAPSAAGAVGGPVTQHWLGPDWWTNRPGDWVARGGRIENVAPAADRRGRIASNLSAELTGGPAVLRVRTGTARTGAGFSGIVLGTGVRGEDTRARAVLGSASGVGGGLMATYESDGRVRLRDHTDERAQFAYEVLATGNRRVRHRRSRAEDVELLVRIRRAGGGRRRLVVTARDVRRDRVLSVLRTVVPRRRVLGGVALVSSDRSRSGARHWFEDFRAQGPGVDVDARRRLGPLVSTLFTCVGGRLRMTAQLMPVDPSRSGVVTLERKVGDTWQKVATSPVLPAFIARFDVPGWGSSADSIFRLRLSSYPARPLYGVVPAEPVGRDVVIGSMSCAKATHRPVDGPSSGAPTRPGEQFLGLYSRRNVWFPFDDVADPLVLLRPDLVVAHGDQYYESSPTRYQREDGQLFDILGRYLLWCWAFRDVTRRTPTVVLVDDHDVYQPNLWGAGGVRVEDHADGGYIRSTSWVNRLQTMQCGHNPVPYRRRTVGDGLRTYYTTFTYGGVDFALLEDRKFKASPRDPRPEVELPQLGADQEQMLARWAADDSGRPKVVLSQTSFVALNTDAFSEPVPDQDANGWPKPARDRVIDSLAGRRVLMVAGDQHSGAVLRHQHPAGGPYQFAAPAVATTFQRWFEPRGDQDDVTGPWTDAFGNRVRVLAVVQPVITRREYAQAFPGLAGAYGQQRFQRRGYGVVRIDPTSQRAELAIWPPARGARSGSPYPGFPITVSLEEPAEPDA
ncbi:alkaline phosphatase D family protein [Nocardioidaceae bacterium]|nr:alkaline phosphatase D family protein [Nocardioidaceae bacterium]